MTAVSLISPYAPQPTQGATPDPLSAPAQTTAPVKPGATQNHAGSASDQSGQGAGSGTGTGGAQLAVLLKRGHDALKVQRPTPKSVVEAQAGTGPASEYLKRQAQRHIEAVADAESRAAREAAVRAASAKAIAQEAARAEYVMPNPIPTAPILEREED